MQNIAGRVLRKHRQQMMDLFGRDLIVRNYTEGAADEYGDSVVSSSEETVEGYIEQPSEPLQASTSQGQTTTIDAEAWLPDETLVTDGSDDNPYPTEIKDPSVGQTYGVIEVFDEGNGWLRASVVSSGYEGN